MKDELLTDEQLLALVEATEAVITNELLRGRRALNAADKARARWHVEGDGNNRASLRKVVATLPRKVRMENRELMQHRQDIAYLMQNPRGTT